MRFTVESGSRAANRLIRELALPESMVVALIAREKEIIPPRGSTRVLPGDHVFLVMRPEARPLVNRVFSRDHEGASVVPSAVEFPLQARATVGDLEEFYGISLDAPRGWTLARLIQERAGNMRIYEGSRLALEGVVLHVREIRRHGIDHLGLEVVLPVESAPPRIVSRNEADRGERWSADL